MRGHDEVVLGRDVVAAVARPSDVKRLALDGAARHVDKLGDNAHLRVVVQVGVFNNRAVDQGQSQVARVDGKADASVRCMHGSPRRNSASSAMSSWISAAVWKCSMAAAALVASFMSPANGQGKPQSK